MASRNLGKRRNQIVRTTSKRASGRLSFPLNHALQSVRSRAVRSCQSGAMLARRQATVDLMRDGLGLLLAEGPLQHICLEEARDLAAGSIVVQGRLVYAV